MFALPSSSSDFTKVNVVCSAQKIWWINYFDVREKNVTGNVEAIPNVVGFGHYIWSRHQWQLVSPITSKKQPLR